MNNSESASNLKPPKVTMGQLVIRLLILPVLLLVIWNFGGGLLWRTLNIFSDTATPLEIIVANESAAPIKIVSVKVGSEIHEIEFNLPPKKEQGSLALDY